MISYILTVFTAYLGSVAGIILGLLNKEELDDGKPYFPIIARIAFALITFFTVKEVSGDIIIAGIVGLFTLATLTLYDMKIKKDAYFVLYVMSALALWIVYNNSLIFALVAGLCFLFGLPVGTRYVIKHGLKKKHSTVVFKGALLHLSFFLVGVILIFWKSF